MNRNNVWYLLLIKSCPHETPTFYLVNNYHDRVLIESNTPSRMVSSYLFIYYCIT